MSNNWAPNHMKLEVKTLISSQNPTSNHIDILQYPSMSTKLKYFKQTSIVCQINVKIPCTLKIMRFLDLTESLNRVAMSKEWSRKQKQKWEICPKFYQGGRVLLQDIGVFCPTIERPTIWNQKLKHWFQVKIRRPTISISCNILLGQSCPPNCLKFFCHK